MEQKSRPIPSPSHINAVDDPERLILRARKLYEKKGYSRRWVNRRFGVVSARQELAGEWFRRGASGSEQFRELTNELTRATFGMDVQGYRKYKGLGGRGAKLRDHMSEFELALTSLSETVATVIHRARNTRGMGDLRSDVHEAGSIVGQARVQIEKSRGNPVVRPGNRPVELSNRARPGPSELANAAKDMHNSTFSPPG